MSATKHLPSVVPAGPSWWFEDALTGERGQPAPVPLVGEIRVDVAIVGGGFTGLWTALALRPEKAQPDPDDRSD